MTHFSLLITGTNIDDQMAPFQEEPDKKYLLFENTFNECSNKYNTELCKAVKLTDGRILNYYDPSFYVKVDNQSTRKFPHNSEIIELPYSYFYKTLDNFITEYCGYDFNEKNNTYGYWYNPNAKWDWFTVGGRWKDYFVLKSNCKEYLHEEYKNIINRCRAGYADAAIKKDIDFESMRYIAGKEAELEWDRIKNITGDISGFVKWDELKDRVNNHSITLNEALSIYNNQDIIVKLRSEQYYDHNEIFLTSKDDYIDLIKLSAVTTFAVLDKNIWSERGNKDKNAWNDEFLDKLNNIDDNEILTLIDCHI